MSSPMFTFDQSMADLLFGYCKERLEMDPVSLDFPGQKEVLDPIVEGLITAQGRDPEEVLRIWTDKLAEAVISVDSPGFLSFIPAAPTKASLMFDMVVSCSSLAATSWLESAGAVVAENQVLDLIAEYAGLGPEAGGCFVSGGSAGNLSALMVGRDVARHKGAQGQLRVALSDQAHSSVGKALRVLDMGALIVPTADHRLEAEALRAAIDADPHPETVVAVVATSGTTNAGIIDDLEGVGRLCRERDLWFHVDGAYGGAGIFSPRIRQRYAGLRHADSMVVDPHKWLFAPFDCAALVYRQPWLAKGVHTQEAGYLDILHEHPDEWNPSDYAYHLTRRARGLPIWFSLAVNGTDAYAEAIDRGLDLAVEAADLIRDTDHVELIRDPELSVVLYRRKGWSKEDYTRWSMDLLNQQVAFVTPTVWEGETVSRFAFLHPDTSMELVQQVLDSMR